MHGRQYLVAPATLIVPGVLNGSRGALYYSAVEVQKHIDPWNGMPLVAYHPVVNGRHASARRPDVLRDSQLGWVFNAGWRDALGAEVWFDEELTANYDKRLRTDYKILPRITQSYPIELSTGLFTDNLKAPRGATFNGRPYDFVARNYRPDHLAVLPDQKGACSVRDGCGVLATPGATRGTTVNARKPTVLLDGPGTANYDPRQARDANGKFKSGYDAASFALGMSQRSQHGVAEGKAALARASTISGDLKTAARLHRETADLHDSAFKLSAGRSDPVGTEAHAAARAAHEEAAGYHEEGLAGKRKQKLLRLIAGAKKLVRRATMNYDPRQLVNYDPNQPRDEDGRFAATIASLRAMSASLGATGGRHDDALDKATERVRKAVVRARASSSGAPSPDVHVKAGKAHQKARAEHQRLRDAPGDVKDQKYLAGVSAHSTAATAHRLAAEAHFAAAEGFGAIKKKPTDNERAANAAGRSRADVSPAKACEILRDGTAQGHKLTKRQRGMFGAICGEKTNNGLGTLPGGSGGKNCGTGAGGFRPGNKCAGGGAHTAYAAVKAVGDRLVAAGKSVSDSEIADQVRKALGDADPKAVYAAAGFASKPKSAKHATDELIAGVRKRLGTYLRSSV